jgi:branched-subunit amino acid ABC-type transport system permease component
VWLTLTRARVLTPGAVIVCTVIAVAAALAVEAAVERVRLGRRRRAHAKQREAA